MIQTRSHLVVADNSGAKMISVIRVLGGGNQRSGSIGDIIVGSVKDALPTGNIKKKSVVKAVIVRTVKPIRREDGSYVSSSDNACVIINDSGEPKGSRVFGPVFRELKTKGYQKIISLAPEVV